LVNIYVGNLAYETGDEDLRVAFSAFGEVTTATVVKDRETGKSRGFGFVEMPDAAAGKAAIDGLNGKDLQGRALKVNEARPQAERGGGGGGGGGGRRGGGGGGGGRRDRW
jgi:cold-inducible RNA-binding protein